MHLAVMCLLLFGTTHCLPPTSEDPDESIYVYDAFGRVLRLKEGFQLPSPRRRPTTTPTALSVDDGIEIHHPVGESVDDNEEEKLTASDVSATTIQTASCPTCSCPLCPSVASTCPSCPSIPTSASPCPRCSSEASLLRTSACPQCEEKKCPTLIQATPPPTSASVATSSTHRPYKLGLFGNNIPKSGRFLGSPIVGGGREEDLAPRIPMS